MEIVKKIVGTIVFFGIGVLLFQAVSYTLRPLDKNFYREAVTGFYAEEEDSLDVVGLGGSSLFCFFDNVRFWEEFGLTSYNLSTASQSNFMFEYLIDEVEKNQSPQLYIIETRRFLLAENKETRSERFCFVIDNMKYSWNRIKLINHMTDDWQERINFYFDIASYHDTWETFTYENLKYIDNEEPTGAKGRVSKEKVKKVKFPEMVPIEQDKEIAISQESEEALRSLLAKCREDDIPVLFIATPWSIDEENQRKNMYIKRIIEDAGFDFLDCNQYRDEIGLDRKTDFWDTRHTNMIGGAKVTRFLGNYIQENYKLSTEHSEEVTEKWNQTVEENSIDLYALRKKLLKKKKK